MRMESFWLTISITLLRNLEKKMLRNDKYESLVITDASCLAVRGLLLSFTWGLNAICLAVATHMPTFYDDAAGVFALALAVFL